MANLLVRNVPVSLINQLKRLAKDHGVSAEDEHRRILREGLRPQPPQAPKLNLLEWAIANPLAGEFELEITRSKDLETHREFEI